MVMTVSFLYRDFESKIIHAFILSNVFVIMLSKCFQMRLRISIRWCLFVGSSVRAMFVKIDDGV